VIKIYSGKSIALDTDKILRAATVGAFGIAVEAVCRLGRTGKRWWINRGCECTAESRLDRL